jgi:hypothetical protein
MSELIQNNRNEKRVRWYLLVTTSAIALLGCTADASARNDEPQVWIELGGQLTRLDVSQETFSPSIMDGRPAMFAPSANYEKLPHQSMDETGKLSFRPGGSGWEFTVAARYGHSVRKVDVAEQTYPAPFVHADPRFSNQDALSAKFASTLMKANESHLLLDFHAGKDLGIGMFGGGTSQINFGIRFAQFNNKSNITLNSNPDWQRLYKYVTYPNLQIYHSKFISGEPYHLHTGKLQAQRSFRGIGPSLAWTGTSPFLGNREDGGLSFDYGVNAAVLFGRQRARVAHQTSGIYRTKAKYPQRIPTGHSTAHNRSRSVVVPNIGAFASMTYRIQHFKVSAGYRADFFFNAMDGGNDARKSEDIGFYGPFATISVGLGG